VLIGTILQAKGRVHFSKVKENDEENNNQSITKLQLSETAYKNDLTH
jgi:hypothetical protein